MRIKHRSYEKVMTQEVDVPTYPNGAHATFGASSPRVRFLEFMFDVKIILEPNFNHILVNDCSHHISS
jgi:hypothetical protein